MQHATGGDLYSYFEARNFRLSEAHIKRIVYELLQGVKYLKSFGVIHRDLKLENVLMSDKTDSAKPIIIDFGLAALIGPGETQNDAFGTPGYMAPELL